LSAFSVSHDQQYNADHDQDDAVTVEVLMMRTLPVWLNHSPPNMNPLEGVQDPEDLQEPDDHSNHHDGIQDSLYGALHWNVAVNHPQNHPHDNQHYHYLQQRHSISPFMSSSQETPN
jgi:hypothetical protein